MAKEFEADEADKALAHELALSGDSRYCDPTLADKIAAALAQARKEAAQGTWEEAIHRAEAVRGRFESLEVTFKRENMADAEERNRSGIEAADRIVRSLERGALESASKQEVNQNE